jgi:uncharacterized repeat protein (TIGR03803 family)
MEVSMTTLGWKRISVVLLLCAMTAIASPAQTLTTLLSFDGPTYPSNLVQGTDGNLYGTTNQGGANDKGSVFKITPSGALTTLHSFSWGRKYPSGLVQATDGNLYGTTAFGGVNDGCNERGGCGMVFKINPAGEFARLYSFCSQANCSDGAQPAAALVQGIDGNFYGTTSQGGATNCGGATACGVVFKITPSGELTTLYRFCAEGYPCTDGAFPVAGLVQATNGNFYGMTATGGGANFYGTFFKITAAGTLTTLHRFHLNYGESGAGLIQATDGNFYGTSFDGGVGTYCPGGGGGCGVVFRLTPAGALSILYSFCTQPNCADGMSPYGLVQATDGSLYGTTDEGGNGYDGYNSGAGTVFKITPAGELTTLYSFCSQTNCTDGSNPEYALVQSTDGKFYGTTEGGGADCVSSGGCGTVFSLSTGLGPFVSFVRGTARVGKTVEILGQGFTGTTGVSFNGTAATFTVKSDTYLTATVPVGATTGPVTVTTPGGTLTSNVPFRVRP